MASADFFLTIVLLFADPEIGVRSFTFDDAKREEECVAIGELIAAELSNNPTETDVFFVCEYAR